MTRRKDGRWQEVITVNGVRKYFYGKTKAEVLRKIQEFESKAGAGVTFNEAADAWHTERIEQVTEKTATNYDAPLRRAKEQFGEELLPDISPAMIQAYIKGLVAKKLAKRTVQLHLDVLSMIFNHAIIQPGAKISVNPCDAVSIPRGLAQKRRLPPTDEQLAAVNLDCRFGLFAYFLMYTGLRPGELRALRYEDIDRENKLIHVTKAVTNPSNKAFIKETKTEAGTRDVDLLDVLADVLPNKKHGFIFGGDKPLSKTQFRKEWVWFCREAGLAEKEEIEHIGPNGHRYVRTEWKPKVTPHQFRHAFASMLDDAGIDETVAKDLLGHSSIVVTKDVYTHLRAAKKERAAAALNKYLAGEPSNEKYVQK